MTEGSGVVLSKYRGDRPNRSHSINVLMASRLLPDKGVKEVLRCCWSNSKEGDFEVEFYLAGPIDSYSPGALSEVQVVEMCNSNHVRFWETGMIYKIS